MGGFLVDPNKKLDATLKEKVERSAVEKAAKQP
jgi:hypothetical protein